MDRKSPILYKVLIRWVTLIGILFLGVGCASTSRTYVLYSDWDTNNDQRISRNEFVDAYLAQGYFDKWGSGASAIGYDELFSEAFESIDTDNNEKLSLIEFNSQINLFYFGLFNEKFDRWDDDSDASISRAEFVKHIAATNFGGLWDTDGSKRITEREMAGGMFYISDSDRSGSVDEIELITWEKEQGKCGGGKEYF